MKKQNRRDFLKAAGIAAGAAVLGAGLVVGCGGPKPKEPEAEEPEPLPEEPPKPAGPSRMQLRFYPYELQLQHTFTVSSYSRNTTPGVQVEIDYQGYTGYGEASMPPYLGQTSNR